MQTSTVVLSVLCLLVAGCSRADAPEESPTSPGSRFEASGFSDAPGRALVIANCTACHSGKLVQQNRATRDGWLEMIRWMQATQRLWPLGAEVEEQILDYLSTQYGRPDDADVRRPGLPDQLRPPLVDEITVRGR